MKFLYIIERIAKTIKILNKGVFKMKNELKKGKACIGQTVIDSEGNEGIITDFFIENGKRSKVVINYSDGTSQTREKYSVQKGAFRKPYLDDIDECLSSNDWKYIPGFNSRYIINKYGKIKSAQGINKGKILTPSQDTNGYLIIGLQISDRNNRKLCRIHQLVIETFIRKPEAGEEINHIDGNKLNNSLANLEIISRSDNNKKYLDFIELGLTQEELRQIQQKCMQENITIKEFLLNKLKE